MVIDVSYWNSDIDWKKVKAAGVKGVILRVGLTGYGTAKTKRADSRFEEYYNGAKAVGLDVGGYWYSCAYTEAEAREEAARMLQYVSGKKFEYPLYMDVEDEHDTTLRGNTSQNQKTIGKATLTRCVKAFCEELEEAGYYCGIYASKYWFNNCLDMTQLDQYAKWIAHYTTQKLDYSKDYGMWQYSSTGKINGISADTDLNRCYVDYPTAIKEKGLNGYWKQSEVELLREENKKLKQIIDDIDKLVDSYVQQS